MDVISRPLSSAHFQFPGPSINSHLGILEQGEGGDDLSIRCAVLGEPDVEVEFRWTYPGQKVSMARPRPAAVVFSSLFTFSQ